jgi:predicted DNA-binding WGR domain protein
LRKLGQDLILTFERKEAKLREERKIESEKKKEEFQEKGRSSLEELERESRLKIKVSFWKVKVRGKFIITI